MTKRNYYNRFPSIDKESDPLVTTAGIARLYSVTPAAASNWVTRYPTFPNPAAVDESGGMAMWRKSDVEEWFSATLSGSLKSLSKRKPAE